MTNINAIWQTWQLTPHDNQCHMTNISNTTWQTIRGGLKQLKQEGVGGKTRWSGHIFGQQFTESHFMLNVWDPSSHEAYRVYGASSISFDHSWTSFDSWCIMRSWSFLLARKYPASYFRLSGTGRSMGENPGLKEDLITWPPDQQASELANVLLQSP